MGKKYRQETIEGKSFFARWKALMNQADKDYWYITKLTIIPILAGLLFIVISFFVMKEIWGMPLKRLPQLVTATIVWFLWSLPGIIWVVKRKTLA